MRLVVLGAVVVLLAVPAVLLAEPHPARARRASAGSTTTEDSYPIVRRVRYGFTVQNTGSTPVRDAEVLAFAPVKQTAMQRTLAVDATPPFELLADTLGNQMLQFRLTLPPFAAKVIRVDARVAFATEPHPGTLRSKQAFLTSEPCIEVNDAAIQQAAATMTGPQPAEAAERMVRWVAEHIEDTGYVAERRGAAAALAQRHGDCTESADLFRGPGAGTRHPRTGNGRIRGRPRRGVDTGAISQLGGGLR